MFRLTVFGTTSLPAAQNAKRAVIRTLLTGVWRVEQEEEKARARPTSDGSDDDLIWGAKAIGSELNREERQAQYLLETGRIPGLKIGNRWVSTRSKLRRRVVELLGP